MMRTYHDIIPQTPADECRAALVEKLLSAYMAEEFTATDLGGIIGYCLHDDWSTEGDWKELYRMHGDYLKAHGLFWPTWIAKGAKWWPLQEHLVWKS
jgi:hypothetical protein